MDYEILGMDLAEFLIGAGLLVICGLILLIINTYNRKLESDDAESPLASHVVPDDPIAAQAAQQETRVGDGSDEDPGGGDVDDEDEPVDEKTRLARMEKKLAEREAKVKAERIRELEERENVIKKKKNPGGTPESDDALEKLLSEKERVMGLIKRAEQSYSRGDLEEDNFKKIVSGYQQQIIDLDIRIRKHREG